MYIQEPHRDKKFPKAAKQLRLIYHPEWRKGIRFWSFKGEGNSWKGDMWECLVNRGCPARPVSLSGENAISSNGYLFS